MVNPSISYPEWMDDEIERRKSDGEPKSHYVRKAVQARFDAEDNGDWVSPDLKPPKDTESGAPADD